MQITAISFAASLVALLGLAVPVPSATAWLADESAVHASARGLSTAERAHVLRNTSKQRLDSGALSSDDYAVAYGSMLADESAMLMIYGVANQSDATEMPRVLHAKQQDGVSATVLPSLTTARHPSALLRAPEPSDPSIWGIDLTPRFANERGTLLGASDSSDSTVSFANSSPGRGVHSARFAFDAPPRPHVDSWLQLGGVSTRQALEASLNNAANDRETFQIDALLGTPPVPEPQVYVLMLVSLSAMIFLNRRRRRIE